MADNFGQFMRTGTFPPNTYKSFEEMNFDGFNIGDALYTTELGNQVRMGECQVLDETNNYFWEKGNF